MSTPAVDCIAPVQHRIVRCSRKPRRSIKGCVKTEFACMQCGVLFIRYKRSAGDPKKPKRSFCTMACRSAAFKGATNPRSLGGSTCPGCQKIFFGRQRIYCSKPCYLRHRHSKSMAGSPQDRLNRNMRRAVLYALRRGVKAGRSWQSLTGFTRAQLMRHLEQLFLPGMTWENYGTHWHVDHKRPVVSFVFEKPEDPDFQVCWALTNLQPLWAKDNLKKNSQYNGTYIRRSR